LAIRLERLLCTKFINIYRHEQKVVADAFSIILLGKAAEVHRLHLRGELETDAEREVPLTELFSSPTQRQKYRRKSQFNWSAAASQWLLWIPAPKQAVGVSIRLDTKGAFISSGEHHSQITTSIKLAHYLSLTKVGQRQPVK
jgi:hypothetical protein